MSRSRPVERGGRRTAWGWAAGLAVATVALVLVVRGLDAAALSRTLRQAAGDPGGLALITGAYALAFVLRAVAWHRTLPGLPVSQALAAIHVSLGANHVLPLRLGEVLRVTSVVRRTDLPVSSVAASTLLLRAADVTAVLLLALVLAPTVLPGLLGSWWPVVLAAAPVGLIAGFWLLQRLRARGREVRLPGVMTLGLVLGSWLLEALVIHQVAGWAGVSVSLPEAVMVTAVTIVAQVAAVAPGGFGTYEAAATAALVLLGADAGTALAVAVSAHLLKTVYALVAGGLGVLVPAPGLLGTLRLPRPAAPSPAGVGAAAQGGEVAAAEPGDADDRPVVLFLPAHDEEAVVADVVARVPAHVAGRRVRCVVVDDGSTDATADRARAAGAEVVANLTNQGLGAAVRRGLAEGVARDAVAVAFCDADGEYAPEELERLVVPVLAGRADYVVGSRFDGEIRHMRPHRRVGNLVLTALLRFVVREPISDGQSGYRALSRRAAEAAHIAHDFNYAQVLTIDLLARGFVYHEVPISYRFRTTGRSFVRLAHYLRAVVPTVWRQLQAPTPRAGSSVLHDVGAEAFPGS